MATMKLQTTGRVTIGNACNSFVIRHIGINALVATPTYPYPLHASQNSNEKRTQYVVQ